LAAVIIRPDSLNNSLNIHPKTSSLLITIIIVVLLAGLGFITLMSSNLARKIRKAAQLLIQRVFRRPHKLFLALLASMAITAGYTFVLYSMGLAFNARLTIVQALFVLTIGVLAATITPTPGGIGGAEAGLVAALISVGVTSHQALTVALTYRFLVYWLPILPGLAAFQMILRRRYI
jgi:uncharacterized protein (TIRG00374 family)